MKRRVGVVALCLLLSMSSSAFAADTYLIEDSDVRKLTKEELWDWTYEALGFVLNELFARHGYHFEEGGKYEAYFEGQTWYAEKPSNMDNAYIYENEMSDIELENEQLIKDVRKEMRRLGTTNPDGKSSPMQEGGAASGAWTGAAATHQPNTAQKGDSAEAPSEPRPASTPEPWKGPYGYELHFEEMILDSERNLKVYSGPGEKYYRGANGKASVSTNDVIYVAGWAGDWLLVKYWTNAGPSRVGYVHRSGLTGEVDAPELALEKREAVVLDDCTYSDDPEFKGNVIGELKAGQKVTFLGAYRRNRQWAYIETKVNGKLVRAFVSAYHLSDVEETADEQK